MNRGAADEPKGENREPVARAEWRKGRRDFVSTGRKLSDEQVIAIRYRVGSGKLSQRRAAIEYEVSQKTIYGIMAGTLYRLPNPTSAPRFRFMPGSSAKRFAYRISGVALEDNPEISERESAYLRGLVYTYRRQIPHDVVTLAGDVPKARRDFAAQQEWRNAEVAKANAVDALIAEGARPTPIPVPEPEPNLDLFDTAEARS